MPSTEPQKDEDFTKALETVCNSIVERGRQEQRKEDAWKDLFAASEQGLKHLLNEAEGQCSHILIGLCDIIEEKFKIKVSNKLYGLLKALPFAWSKVTKGIKEEQGYSCCVDKTRFLYYQEVLEEIRRIQNVDGHNQGSHQDSDAGQE